MNNYKSGHFAEILALWLLRIKGYRKVRMNYFIGRGNGAGEVDLIMSKGKTIVFIEVKKRTSLTDASYAILPKQQKRIRRTAEVFIKNNNRYSDYNIRFDAVLISFPFCFCHLKNAF